MKQEKILISIADLYSNQEVCLCLPISVCLLCSVNYISVEQEIRDQKKKKKSDLLNYSQWSILCREIITFDQDKLCNICFDFLRKLPTVQIQKYSPLGVSSSFTGCAWHLCISAFIFTCTWKKILWTGSWDTCSLSNSSEFWCPKQCQCQDVSASAVTVIVYAFLPAT